MSLSASLKQLGQTAAQTAARSAANLDISLLRAAQIRGDFPVSLRLLEKIKLLLAESKVDRAAVVKLIGVDPLLALRLVSLANHDYYRKGQQIFTPTQALRLFAESRTAAVVADLAEAKNFNAIFLGRAVAVTMMQQTIIAAVLSRQLIRRLTRKPDLAERTLLGSALTNLAPLLLAFYHTPIYSSLCLDCTDDRDKFQDLFRQVTRKSIGEFGAAFSRTLSLPNWYGDLVRRTDEAPWKEAKAARPEADDLMAAAIYTGNRLAHEICYHTGIQGMQSLIRELDQDSPFAQSLLDDIVGTVADTYVSHTLTLELKTVRLPEYLLWFTPAHGKHNETRWRRALPGISERLNPFLYELRTCLKARPPEGSGSLLSQAVHCTLHGLIKGLNFDRAVLLRVDEQQKLMAPALVIGVKLYQPERLRRFLEDPDAEKRPELTAFNERRTVFEGEALFPDGWPFVAFPIVWRDQVVAVFYADKIKRPDSEILSAQEQIGCVALAEEWQNVAADFA